MITPLYIYRDRSIWFVTTCIVILFAIVPYSIIKFNVPLLFVVVGLGIYMTLNKIKGVCVLIFAFSLMIPSTASTIGLGATRYISYIYVALTLILYAFFVKKTTFYKFTFTSRLIFPILVLGLLFSFANATIYEALTVVFFVLSTYGVFRLSLLDTIELRPFYVILDILFYFTLIYVVQEFYFGNSPYQLIYDDKLVGLQERAKGLLGHPLILSFFLSFYIVSQITQGMLLKRWNYFNFLVAIPFLLICASRTSFILIGVAVLFYIVAEKKYLSLPFMGVIIVLGGAVSVVLTSSGSILNDDLYSRLLSSAADQRIGAYSVAGNIFSEHVFGIGLSLDALKAELSRGSFHASSKYDPVFLTIDNAYLSLLIGYGVLCLLFYPIYISPLSFGMRYAKNKRIRKHLFCLALIFVIWLLQNLSFDTFYYFPINAFYFLLSGLIIRDMRKHIKKPGIIVTPKEDFSISIAGKDII